MSTGLDEKVPVSSRVGILGVGAVGARVARQLVVTSPALDVVLADSDGARSTGIAKSLGHRASAVSVSDLEEQDLSVLVVATPSGRHIEPVDVGAE